MKIILFQFHPFLPTYLHSLVTFYLTLWVKKNIIHSTNVFDGESGGGPRIKCDNRVQRRSLRMTRLEKLEAVK